MANLYVAEILCRGEGFCLIFSSARSFKAVRFYLERFDVDYAMSVMNRVACNLTGTDSASFPERHLCTTNNGHFEASWTLINYCGQRSMSHIQQKITKRDGKILYKSDFIENMIHLLHIVGFC